MLGYGRSVISSFFLTCSLCASSVFAESQINDYPGVKDPFGDPSNYEFSEDEQQDKEFFHLGRFLMLGVDIGAGLFTGGLGKSTAPAVMVGGRFLFFFDRAIALEGAVHYAYHIDNVTSTGGGTISYDVDFIPITFGFRYYFDTKGAPRAITFANPYLAAGAGVYLRSLSPAQASSGITAAAESTKNFGIYGGAGAEFLVYGTHLYMGADVRYHMVFFTDESSTLNNMVPSGERAGDYITTLLTMTYNF